MIDSNQFAELCNSNNMKLLEIIINDHIKNGCKEKNCHLCRNGISVAQRLNINPEHFEFHLSRDLGEAIRTFSRGPVVHVFLAWPEVLEELNTIIYGSLITIRDKKLRSPTEVISMAIVHTAQDDLRKLLSKNRRHFDELSDIVMDLIPKHQIQIEESTVITLTHPQTGESISVSKKGKKTRFDGEDIALWMQLSRIVRDKRSITKKLELVADSETPELDKVSNDE